MKTLTVYHPKTIQNALSDFDRCVESFFGNPKTALAARNFNLPAVDVQESGNAYILDMELPGYDEKNIEIHVEASNLTIASKTEEQTEKKEEEQQSTFIIKERRTSSFCRTFKLPENADPETVSAVFKNGILCLEIKKRAETQKKIVQIKAA